MLNNFFIKKNSRGFTFIELVIVVAIMALIFTLGTASLRQYQRKQYFDKIVRDFVSDLNLLRSYALSGKKPDTPPHNCITLNGFELKLRRINDNYGLGVVCKNALGVEINHCNLQSNNSDIMCLKFVDYDEIGDGSVDLNYSVNTNELIINFDILGKGISCSSYDPIPTITLTYKGMTKNIVISKTGEISITN